MRKLKTLTTDSPSVKAAKQKARAALKRVYQKQMREAQTPAEAFLWESLRDSALGVKFTPQAIVHGFLPDFWCGELKLAIEVDGGIHAKQVSYDKWREGILHAHGIKVLRFTNGEVFSSRETCIIKIRYIIGQIKQRKEREKAQTKKPKWKR